MSERTEVGAMDRPRTNREIGEVAKALGHTDLAVWQRPNGRWQLDCSCGYSSTGRNTINDAVGAGKHHLRLVVAEHFQNGSSAAFVRSAG